MSVLFAAVERTEMPRWPADRVDVEAYPGPGYDLTVFYNDLDPNGHLNNVALGRFFEQARVAQNGAAGLPASMRGTGANVMVGRVAIDYLAEGRYGLPLHLRTRLARLGQTSATLEQAAWQNGHPIALAEAVLVHVRDGVPVVLTDAVRAAFEHSRRPDARS